jgi:hypothetical protein
MKEVSASSELHPDMESRLRRALLPGESKMWLHDVAVVTWPDEDKVSGEGDDEVVHGAASSDKASVEVMLWHVAVRKQRNTGEAGWRLEEGASEGEGYARLLWSATRVREAGSVQGTAAIIGVHATDVWRSSVAWAGGLAGNLREVLGCAVRSSVTRNR